MLGHVSGAGHQAGFALKGFIAVSEHLGRKIDHPVSGGLEPHIAAAPLQPFTGQDTTEFIALFFIHAKHVPDFSGTHAQTAVGDVGVLPDVVRQLAHKTLAKSHDLVI